MPAYNFERNGNMIADMFAGEFKFKEVDFQYELYLTPFTHPDTTTRVKTFFGNRMFKGASCLGIDEASIQEYIDNEDISLFGIVRSSLNPLDTGSGTIQLFNYCSKAKGRNNAQAWINDICRTTDGEKTPISPVEALFYIFEQFVIHNLRKPDIYLFTEIDKAPILTPIYERYGFEITTACNSDPSAYVIMRKTIDYVQTQEFDLFDTAVPASSAKHKAVKSSTSTRVGRKGKGKKSKRSKKYKTKRVFKTRR